MPRGSIPPIVLRNGLDVGDPVELVLEFLETYSSYPRGAALPPTSFREPDLRLANRGGARIAASQIGAILERRRAIERALRDIAPDASLAGAGSSVPWLPLGRLFDAFAGIQGVGFSKMTKALHPKRPALIPILDSVVQAYLVEDLGAEKPYGERALSLVRGYKRDLDRNRRALRAVGTALARRGYRVTEVRLLDVLIWSAGSTGPGG
jgi:Family of unknown function (DUF6308)